MQSMQSIHQCAANYLHGLLEHDVAENELHKFLCGHLQLAVQEYRCTPAAEHALLSSACDAQGSAAVPATMRRAFTGGAALPDKRTKRQETCAAHI